MIDIPDDVRRQAADLAGRTPAPLTTEEAIAGGIMAERERIAIWHEQQADALEAAIQQVLSEGGEIETSRRSMVEVHRGFAAAIRRGEA